MDKQLVPNNQFGSSRTELLFLDTSSFSNEGALPGYLPLFEGMPVILRYKNLCVELCVANGSQGTIHKIETEQMNMVSFVPKLSSYDSQDVKYDYQGFLLKFSLYNP